LEVPKDSFCRLKMRIRGVQVKLRELLDCIGQFGLRTEHCIYEGANHGLILLDVCR
jgi:hypothetical protein